MSPLNGEFPRVSHTAPQGYDRCWTTVLRRRRTTNLDDISIFVAVAEAGTFTAAAAHLQLPVSTISRSLTRLEKNMDLLLVRRSQRGLALLTLGRNTYCPVNARCGSYGKGASYSIRHRAKPFRSLTRRLPHDDGSRRDRASAEQIY